VQITSGDVTGDAADEIIVGQGAGGSLVRVFSFDAVASTASQIRSFTAYEAGYKGGVTVASADTDPTNFFEEIITGKASQLPHVKVFNAELPDVVQLMSYMAFNINNPLNRRGIDVVAGNTTFFSSSAEIYVALRGTSTVRFFRGDTGVVIGTLPRIFPLGYSQQVNFAINETGGGAFFIEDLIVVAGDGPYAQVPIIYDGGIFTAAGQNGSRPAA
jgi:hypothetical protein